MVGTTHLAHLQDTIAAHLCQLAAERFPGVAFELSGADAPVSALMSMLAPQAIRRWLCCQWVLSESKRAVQLTTYLSHLLD